MNLSVWELEIGDEVIEGLEHLLNRQRHQRPILNTQTIQESQSPVATCMMKQSESPYLISASPMPSMSRLGLCSSFSCTGGERMNNVVSVEPHERTGTKTFRHAYTDLLLINHRANARPDPSQWEDRNCFAGIRYNCNP
ncbi:hypothetical protein EYF80_002436 [Liparis tanakae]|uniref:Uncharacterized protein n=1 Tax=Liparis tanakae TaxID=230148 RepID=A0A4Z2JBM1_9TELE|nr:hypothetical protein EYF80_002436 [Liparis tanakae]